MHSAASAVGWHRRRMTFPAEGARRGDQSGADWQWAFYLQIPVLPGSLCVYSCVCKCTCVRCIFMCLHACGGQRTTLDASPQISSILNFLKKYSVSYLPGACCFRQCWLARNSRDLLVHFPNPGIKRRWQYAYALLLFIYFFRWVLRIWLASSASRAIILAIKLCSLPPL